MLSLSHDQSPKSQPSNSSKNGRAAYTPCFFEKICSDDQHIHRWNSTMAKRLPTSCRVQQTVSETIAYTGHTACEYPFQASIAALRCHWIGATASSGKTHAPPLCRDALRVDRSESKLVALRYALSVGKGGGFGTKWSFRNECRTGVRLESTARVPAALPKMDGADA